MIRTLVLGIVCMTLCACTPRHEEVVMKGVTIADDFPDYTSDACARLCDSLHRAGVTWVAITPCGFLDSTQSTAVKWTWFSRRDYARAIRMITSKGMKVLVKPYLWSKDFWHKQEWTGMIRHDDTASRAAFFASYRTWLLDIMRQAEAGGAGMVCIGLELPQLSTDEHAWRSLIKESRAIYHGKLTYASHGIDEASNIRFWDALDVIGVNIYPSLSNAPSPTDKAVRNGWKPILAALQHLSAVNGNKKIAFTEAGFRSVERATFSPWEWPEHRPRAVRHEEQVQAYRLLAEQTYHQPWFGGIFWWKVFTDPEMENEGPDGFSPQGKPAWRQMSDDFLRHRTH